MYFNILIFQLIKASIVKEILDTCAEKGILLFNLEFSENIQITDEFKAILSRVVYDHLGIFLLIILENNEYGVGAANWYCCKRNVKPGLKE